MWTLITGKELGYIHIISFISSIILFILIILYKHRELKTNLSYLIVIITYWFIATALITCGAVIHFFVWLILQNGFSGIIAIHYDKLIAAIIIGLMLLSFPGLLISLITIKEPGYLNNFNRIFISGIMLLFIPDIIDIITYNKVRQANEVFYIVFNNLIGIFLLGLLLSLIITKLNITIFKQEKKDKLQIEYYFIVSIVFALALSLLVYLFFLTQLSSNITIKLTDWKAITLRTTEKGLKYEVLSPEKMIDLPKDQKEGDVFLVGPVGKMQINSVDYDLAPADTILIFKATRIHIEKNIKDELVIDAISRIINFESKALPMTIWSTVSPGQKTTIIAGIFLIISTIIGSMANIYIKIKKKNL